MPYKILQLSLWIVTVFNLSKFRCIPTNIWSRKEIAKEKSTFRYLWIVIATIAVAWWCMWVNTYICMYNFPSTSNNIWLCCMTCWLLQIIAHWQLLPLTNLRLQQLLLAIVVATAAIWMQLLCCILLTYVHACIYIYYMCMYIAK